ncbi:hypothetical protein CDAR_538291 [Caerostris darwini]|uniref:Uncharacterized protein n=1 Tax=Caerostris darwini TaxID=1538125 RepID=A0AAV4UCK3_9ARAC|nr:hypothetical protein CDAR_538291 [Caerostris darwini]
MTELFITTRYRDLQNPQHLHGNPLITFLLMSEVPRWLAVHVLVITTLSMSVITLAALYHKEGFSVSSFIILGNGADLKDSVIIIHNYIVVLATCKSQINRNYFRQIGFELVGAVRPTEMRTNDLIYCFHTKQRVLLNGDVGCWPAIRGKRFNTDAIFGS